MDRPGKSASSAYITHLQELFMLLSHVKLVPLSLLATCLFSTTAAQAALVKVSFTIENLAPANSIAFAPLRFGFNNGSFDAFNQGEAAGPAIVSVAEGGSGSAWLPAFAAADPTAVLGSSSGALMPGAMSSVGEFMINTAVNQYFTFGSMVIPSNDFFIGNDSPTEYRLFDANGNLLINSITQTTNDIWNAGSEAFNPLHAAFVAGGNNDLRDAEGGVVGFNFSELAGFNGLTTAAGYVFDDQLTNGAGVYRISFKSSSAPEPGSLSLAAAGLLVAGLVRRRKVQGVTELNHAGA
jgi:uncharacterized protein (TIGR03382 family)